MCPTFSAVSHSVMSEMQLIEQETPIGAKSSSRSKLDMFDEPGFTSGPPKYNAHTANVYFSSASWNLPAQAAGPKITD